MKMKAEAAWRSFVNDDNAKYQTFLLFDRIENKSKTPQNCLYSSRSHSAGYWIEIGLVEAQPSLPQKILGIGVDLEHSRRVVSESVIERVVHSSEKIWNLPFLDYWVVKEACFKADPHSFGSVITQYRITNFIPSQTGGDGEAASAQSKFRFRILHWGGWTLGFAYCFNFSSDRIPE